MSELVKKLGAMGLTLPPAPRPVASYVPAVCSDRWVVVSGQLPMREGKLLATGPVPSVVKAEEAKAAAGQCALNALAVLDDAIGGDWSRFVRIVRVGVFVQCDDGYGEIPQIANGASDLLVQVFGEAGKHARSAVGSNALPMNASVEVELIAEMEV